MKCDFLLHKKNINNDCNEFIHINILNNNSKILRKK